MHEELKQKQWQQHSFFNLGKDADSIQQITRQQADNKGSSSKTINTSYKRPISQIIIRESQRSYDVNGQQYYETSFANQDVRIKKELALHDPAPSNLYLHFKTNPKISTTQTDFQKTQKLSPVLSQQYAGSHSKQFGMVDNQNHSISYSKQLSTELGHFQGQNVENTSFDDQQTIKQPQIMNRQLIQRNRKTSDIGRASAIQSNSNKTIENLILRSSKIQECQAQQQVSIDRETNKMQPDEKYNKIFQEQFDTQEVGNIQLELSKTGQIQAITSRAQLTQSNQFEIDINQMLGEDYSSIVEEYINSLRSTVVHKNIEQEQQQEEVVSYQREVKQMEVEDLTSSSVKLKTSAVGGEDVTFRNNNFSNNKNHAQLSAAMYDDADIVQVQNYATEQDKLKKAEERYIPQANLEYDDQYDEDGFEAIKEETEGPLSKVGLNYSSFQQSQQNSQNQSNMHVRKLRVQDSSLQSVNLIYEKDEDSYSGLLQDQEVGGVYPSQSRQTFVVLNDQDIIDLRSFDHGQSKPLSQKASQQNLERKSSKQISEQQISQQNLMLNPSADIKSFLEQQNSSDEEQKEVRGKAKQKSTGNFVQNDANNYSNKKSNLEFEIHHESNHILRDVSERSDDNRKPRREVSSLLQCTPLKQTDNQQVTKSTLKHQPQYNNYQSSSEPRSKANLEKGVYESNIVKAAMPSHRKQGSSIKAKIPTVKQNLIQENEARQAYDVDSSSHQIIASKYKKVHQTRLQKYQPRRDSSAIVDKSFNLLEQVRTKNLGPLNQQALNQYADNYFKHQYQKAKNKRIADYFKTAPNGSTVKSITVSTHRASNLQSISSFVRETSNKQSPIRSNIGSTLKLSTIPNKSIAIPAQLSPKYQQSIIDSNQAFSLVEQIKQVYGASQHPSQAINCDRTQKWGQVVKFMEQNPQVMMEIIPIEQQSKNGIKSPLLTQKLAKQSSSPVRKDNQPQSNKYNVQQKEIIRKMKSRGLSVKRTTIQSDQNNMYNSNEGTEKARDTFYNTDQEHNQNIFGVKTGSKQSDRLDILILQSAQFESLKQSRVGEMHKLQNKAENQHQELKSNNLHIPSFKQETKQNGRRQSQASPEINNQMDSIQKQYENDTSKKGIEEEQFQKEHPIQVQQTNQFVDFKKNHLLSGSGPETEPIIVSFQRINQNAEESSPENIFKRKSPVEQIFNKTANLKEVDVVSLQLTDLTQQQEQIRMENLQIKDEKQQLVNEREDIEKEIKKLEEEKIVKEAQKIIEEQKKRVASEQSSLNEEKQKLEEMKIKLEERKKHLQEAKLLEQRMKSLSSTRLELELQINQLNNDGMSEDQYKEEEEQHQLQEVNQILNEGAPNPYSQNINQFVEQDCIFNLPDSEEREEVNNGSFYDSEKQIQDQIIKSLSIQEDAKIIMNRSLIQGPRKMSCNSMQLSQQIEIISQNQATFDLKDQINDANQDPNAFTSSEGEYQGNIKNESRANLNYDSDHSTLRQRYKAISYSNLSNKSELTHNLNANIYSIIEDVREPAGSASLQSLSAFQNSSQSTLFDWAYSEIMSDVKRNRIAFNFDKSLEWFKEEELDYVLEMFRNKHKDFKKLDLIQQFYIKAIVTLEYIMGQLNAQKLFSKIKANYSEIDVPTTFKLLVRCKLMIQARNIVYQTLKTLMKQEKLVIDIKQIIDSHLEDSVDQTTKMTIEHQAAKLPKYTQAIKTNIISIRDEFKLLSKTAAITGKNTMVSNIFIFQRKDALKQVLAEYENIRKLLLLFDVKTLPFMSMKNSIDNMANI